MKQRVETIDDMASQTNHLTLNAPIEAARADEQGKGFAVVADEARKLAEKSATGEIADLIQGIQYTVAEAISAIEDSTMEVKSGVSRANDAGQALTDIFKAVKAVAIQVKEILIAAQQMSSSSNELVSAIDTVSAAVEENSAATEEIAAGSGEVPQVIDNISHVSEENSAAVEEASAATEEMSTQAQEVSTSVQLLSKMAQNLKELVARFNLTKANVHSATQPKAVSSERCYI